MKIEVVPPKEAIEAAPIFVNNVRIVGDLSIGGLVLYFSHMPADAIQLPQMAGMRDANASSDPDGVFRLEIPPVAKLAISAQAIPGMLEALTVAYSGLQKGIEDAGSQETH